MIEATQFTNGDTKLSVVIKEIDKLSDSRILFEKIANDICEKYIELHGNEIMGKFDQQAISNIAIAKVAQRVAEIYLDKDKSNEK
jgi:hypothetical protein